MMQIRNLLKKYSDQTVLDNINFNFEKGAIYGVVGINGAGKTTLLNCLTKNIDFQGEISYHNKLTIGYLPDNLFFYSKTTGIEYLEFFISARGHKIDIEKINRLNEIFELPLYTKYTSDYSAGMKKKLGFLAVLLQNNDLYILDEPFNNLDIKAVMEFQQIIGSLSKKNKTVIISSHILDPLKNICNTITILSNGKLISTFEKENFHKVDYFFKETISSLKEIDEII
jgi:ABC-2 type transport system ATP-binding protein